MTEPDVAESTDETVVGRWSRRKAAAATTDEVAPAGIDEVMADAQTPAVSESALSTAVTVSRQEQLPVDEDEKLEPLLTDEDMPDVGTLTSDSNVSCFFNRGVSEKLRQAALKKLLHLPAFNIRDGLNDYDEDYSYFEPLGDIITSDMRYHKERLEALANREAEEHTDEIDSDSDITEVEANDQAEADASDRADSGNESTDTETDSRVTDDQSDSQTDERTESEELSDDMTKAHDPEPMAGASGDYTSSLNPISPGEPA